MSHDGPNGEWRRDGVLNEVSGREPSLSCRDARVWLRGTIAEVDKDVDGRLLSLLIGAARVSVLVGREDDHFASWAAGMFIDIHIDRYEAWVKPCGRDCAPVLCGLLYLDHQSLAGAR
ncbi:MAG: hypothetical protein LZF60_260030 [Nitrospira sp.]|nr:hypothetical protein [Nitrospira sp.]ULA60635.1 MAG: hypothetical protein LZF60_260030 [Nitrospira sp.]